MTAPRPPEVGARVDLALAHNVALSVPCGECGAPRGSPCINRWSGKPHTRLPACLQRIKAANSVDEGG